MVDDELEGKIASISIKKQDGHRIVDSGAMQPPTMSQKDLSKLSDICVNFLIGTLEDGTTNSITNAPAW